MKRRLVLAGMLLLALPLFAQESASYRLSDSTFNSGGKTLLTSPSYQLTFVGIGESAVENELSSPSFTMDGSFGASHPPPGEVESLQFVDSQTLVWDPERSAGNYNLYRNLLSDLSSLQFGQCHRHDLGEETTTDPAVPPSVDGYFYLVTVKNRLSEEGTKGFDSAGSMRANAGPCP